MVFAKAPVPGTVKTRLIPALGVEGAAKLHRRLLWQTLVTAAQLEPPPVGYLYAAPDTRHGFLRRCARRFRLQLVPQRGADLGERLANAFDEVLARHRKALVIGADCISLTAADLATALQWLEASDAVLGPALDGGYLLLGLRAPCRALFEAVPWSGPLVLATTRQRLRRANLAWRELAAGYDIDEPPDLQRLRGDPRFASWFPRALD
ncbi:MAG: TIGR04282 family arsenosugar biosynthesis glycosyltransferase [Candidatus Competibacterales bacterium]